MRFNTAIIISLITLGIGFFFHKPLLWLPISILLAGVVDLFTRQWVASDRLGRARNLSMSLKGIFALIGFYGTVGQIACIVLIVWWFLF